MDKLFIDALIINLKDLAQFHYTKDKWNMEYSILSLCIEELEKYKKVKLYALDHPEFKNVLESIAPIEFNKDVDEANKQYNLTVGD